jgi:long-subunit fatty acid transport protein
MKKIRFFILILLFSSTIIRAQQTSIGCWNIVNAKFSFNKNWSILGEAQVRSFLFYSNFHYYEYKGIIAYKINKNIAIGIGVGSYQTYTEGGNFKTPKSNNEVRIWPQIIITNTIGAIKLEQRCRAESRFTSNGYRNRYRYRLGLTYFFGKTSKGYQPFQLTACNELFFTNEPTYFERNRLQLACSYKATANTTFQIGFINQFDYKINSQKNQSYFQTGIFIELF